MAEEKRVCTSCGKTLFGKEMSAQFPCPSCGEVTIKRCETCRRYSNPYICEKCGFKGP